MFGWLSGVFKRYCPASARLLLGANRDWLVRLSPSPRLRQRECGKLCHELSRTPSVKIESIHASEATRLGWASKEAREGCGLRLRCDDEGDHTPLGAHRGPLGELRLEPLDSSFDDETRNALDDEAMCAGIGDVGAEHDSRVRTTDDEGTPALPLATSDESSFVDREAHGAALIVEEAGVDRNGSRKWRGDLFHSLLRGRAGGHQAKLRDTEIDLEGVAREELTVWGAHLEDRVRDPLRHCQKPRRVRPHRAGPDTTHHQEGKRDVENEDAGPPLAERHLAVRPQRISCASGTAAACGRTPGRS